LLIKLLFTCKCYLGLQYLSIFYKMIDHSWRESSPDRIKIDQSGAEKLNSLLRRTIFSQSVVKCGISKKIWENVFHSFPDREITCPPCFFVYHCQHAKLNTQPIVKKFFSSLVNLTVLGSWLVNFESVGTTFSPTVIDHFIKYWKIL
jgi:hypothetical protein